MSLLGGRLCEVTYTNPLLPGSPPLKNVFYSNQGGGEWALLPLSYMRVTVVQPGFVNGGPKRGSEATERGRVFPPPTVGRFFENLCIKTTFSFT